MSEPFLGEIKMVAYNFAPRGWAFCNGQLLSIAQNTALFSLLGTTFGGNGQTTFALPDLRSRTPIHWGNGPSFSPTLGQNGGEENHTLTANEMPTHPHGMVGATAPAAPQRAMTGNYLGNANTNLYAATAASAMNPGVVGTAGGSQPHNNLQPYLVVGFCIAVQGIFPSRN